MSLKDAIQRNRARQAQRRNGEPVTRQDEGLRAYTVNVLVNPPIYMIELGLATVHEEKRTIYGHSLKDAKERAGVE